MRQVPADYREPSHLLDHRPSFESILKFVRETVLRQQGMAIFVTHHRSGLRHAYQLREALEDKYDVLINKADPESDFAYQRYKYERSRVEILVRAMNHPSLAEGSAATDRPAIVERLLSGEGVAD